MNQDYLLENYDYEIPQELIAQKPAERRDASRLFVVNKSSGNFCHRKFSDIVEYFSEGDCLVINDTKVVPSRLFGKKISGGKVELLFLDPFQTEGDYRVLMKPSIDAGKKVYFEDGYECEIKSKTPSGEVIVSFNKGDIMPMLEKYGIMPLPPYINRKNGLAQELADFDKQHYQTVYAQNDGAIAAPTAGLHFTREVFKALKNKGVNIAKLTLHVGWGTFKPIVSDKLPEHKMMPEKFFIDGQNAQIINSALLGNKKVAAVGTTSARALESAAICAKEDKDGKVLLKEYGGSTDIFIYPGYEFKIVSTLITNLHLPKSTPLMMASAFAGRELMLKAYKEAVKEKYRFFSYGDSMLIL
jgi:S-adenosylmethionine:tRNA ribosyltransferase-isomerase